MLRNVGLHRAVGSVTGERFGAQRDVDRIGEREKMNFDVEPIKLETLKERNRNLDDNNNNNNNSVRTSQETVLLYNKAQPVNSVCGNNRCLL
jgi:hypothetical protein